MTNVFHLINSKYSSLSRSERTVAEYILQNPGAVMLMSMRGLAEKTNLSDNTVLRFCRTCGFSGYLDFKTALLPHVTTENGSIYKQVDTTDRFTLWREKISDGAVGEGAYSYVQILERRYHSNINEISLRHPQNGL